MVKQIGENNEIDWILRQEQINQFSAAITGEC